MEVGFVSLPLLRFSERPMPVRPPFSPRRAASRRQFLPRPGFPRLSGLVVCVLAALGCETEEHNLGKRPETRAPN